MKSQRPLKNSYQMNQVLAQLATRTNFSTDSVIFGDPGEAAGVKEAFTRCFNQPEEEDLTLKDEFSAKLIEFVVSECRILLQETRGSAECWRQMGEFLDQELWKLIRLKEELGEAEKQVGMVRGKLAEASAPLHGEIRKKRVMACMMLLAEKEMRRDHLQERVSMIIDQFVLRILAGTQKEPGGEILELRLRGVFGSL
jgi:hypothetical protein